MKKFFNYFSSILPILLLPILAVTLVFADIERDSNVSLIRKYSAIYGVDPAISLAIGKIESDYTTKAFNENKKAKHRNRMDRESHGVMQLTFPTAKSFNPEIVTMEDLYNPEKNVKAGVLYIHYLLKRYPHYSVEDIASLYNSGEPLFFKGKISADYRAKFMKIYRLYKPIVVKKTVNKRHKKVKKVNIISNITTTISSLATFTTSTTVSSLATFTTDTTVSSLETFTTGTNVITKPTTTNIVIKQKKKISKYKVKHSNVSVNCQDCHMIKGGTMSFTMLSPFRN